MDIVERLKARVKSFESVGNENTHECRDLRDAITEIESLRKQFIHVMTESLGKLKQTEEIMKDTRERLDRAGL